MAVMFRSVLQNAGGAAELVVTCASEFAGVTISCSDGTTTLNKTCPSSSPYEVLFKIPNSGNWTVSATVSGVTYSSDPVSVLLDYTTDLDFGFNWQTWVDTAQYLDSTDYSTLADLLADEEAVRELCTEHATVDYLCRYTDVNTDLETVINNDIFAKWVNLRDYSLDKMYANAAIADEMDTAGKYGYGEWALMPQVPTMTSNTAPYGTASAGSEQYGSAYQAFDGSDSTAWAGSDAPSIGSSATNWIKYHFPSPVCVTRVYESIYSGIEETNFIIEGSNDDSDYTSLTVSELSSNYREVTNNTAYSYYKVTTTQKNVSATNRPALPRYATLQFYAYAPKGNVPVMTSNTAPYGTASATTIASSSFQAYQAFDNNPSTAWSAGSTANAILSYQFTNPVCVKKVFFDTGKDSSYSASAKTWDILAKNSASDSWEVIYSGSNDDVKLVEQEIDNDAYYLYWGIKLKTSYRSNSYALLTLQFYGRELSVSVPKMDTNTTPYGVAIYSSEYSSQVNTNGAWHAFDNDDTTLWGATLAATNNYVGYEFNNLTKLSMVDVLFRQGVSSSGYFVPERTFKVQGYTNGEWVDIGTITVPQSPTSTTTKRITLDTISDNACEKFRIFCAEPLSNSGANYTLTVCSLQFYGFDYSEREFEEGATKKWLYDHGLELETANEPYGGGSNTYINYESSRLVFGITDGSSLIIPNWSVDFTSYNLARAKITNNYNVDKNDLRAMNSSGTYIGGLVFTTALLPNNIGYDVSSINQDGKLGICVQGSTNTNPNGHSELAELWLE